VEGRDLGRRARSFGAAAELYDRARPGYPPDAVGWMLGQTARDVVDLGAGTGIFSRLVASLGHRVTAIEPDPQMRAQLATPQMRAQLATSDTIAVLDGSAERIPLPDRSTGAVVAAQAFHWFDNHDARAEIARVLADGGVFAPIWNVRDESVEWVAELTRILGGGAATSAAVHARVGRQFGPLYRRAARAEFRHSVPMTSDTLLDVVRTRSRYLVAEEDDRREIDRGVSELVSGLPEQFELPYVAVAFRAEVLR
jgi:SAM-dependent methyltransferase